MYRTTLRYALRRNLRAVLAIGVLCGLVVGVGLWGLATSRRTASTYERYFRDANASDLSVNVNSAERALTLPEVVELIDEAGGLEGVTDNATYVGMESMLLETDVEAPLPSLEMIGSLDGRFLDQDRVALSAGRLPDADQPDEVLVNGVAAAQRGLEVGDTVGVLVADIKVLEAAEFDDPSEIPIAGSFDAKIVGIGTFADDVLDDEYDRIGRLLLTPAATERWLATAGSYVWHGMQLEDPSEADAVLTRYRELAGDGVFLSTQVTADQQADVQRSLRPLVVALAVFGTAALLFGLAVGAVALARVTRNRPELLVLRSIGMRPRQLLAVGAAPAVLSALVAGTVGIVVAVALSPFAPVGAIRAVEPDRGVDVDGLVLGAGLALTVGVLVAAAVAAATRGLSARTSPQGARSTRTMRLGASLTPSAALGIRRGLGSSPVGGAPGRAALLGTVLAVLAVVASLTFGASLTELSDHPERYGWNTDLALTAGAGYDTIDVDEASRLADRDDRVTGLTIAGFTDVPVGDEVIPAMAFVTPRGDAAVTLLSGALPVEPDEVALGGRTASRLGVGIGDELAGPEGPLQVVGKVAFPAIGPSTSAHPGMGEGVLLTLEAIGEEGAQPSIVFLNLTDDVDAAAVAQELTNLFVATTDGGFMEPFLLLRPAELDGAEDANATIAAIAGIVGVAAIAGLATVVMASVRARRRELAVLRVLGCTARDLRRSVGWQAASLIVVALLVGLPLGVAGGRSLWQTFADTLGVDPAPTVPVVTLLGAAAAAAVLALLAAIPAASQAARMPVAPALRPE